ncbi:MAG TPA: hypothetical protein VHU40_13910 [Polyangia bacterium]|jgi:hypothetical protein|nr:hypothetical protein [Polyangia bacterium]
MGRAWSFHVAVLGSLFLLGVACGPGATTEGTGGSIATGGQPGATGGATGSSGGSGSGGTTSPGTGGRTDGTGGATSTGGGTTSSGGTTGPTGGAKGTGGATATGGATGNGGRSMGSGGATGMGGRPTGSGGAGGRASGGGGSTTGGGGAGGCVANLACKLNPPASSGDLHQDCVDRINQFLTQCACLPALARATEGEACADQMAEYDAGMNTAHAGVRANICKPNGSQNECPGYSSNSQVIGLCMQQMWDEGPPPAGSCTGTCYEQHGHFINMTDKSVHKVACGFFTTSAGKVWAVQNFF